MVRGIEVLYSEMEKYYNVFQKKKWLLPCAKGTEPKIVGIVV
jgi:hypothetical protein